jgi:hypothetical protein
LSFPRFPIPLRVRFSLLISFQRIQLALERIAPLLRPGNKKAELELQELGLP